MSDSAVLLFNNAYNLPRRDYAPGSTVRIGGGALFRVLETVPSGVRVIAVPLDELEWIGNGERIVLRSGEAMANEPMN